MKRLYLVRHAKATKSDGSVRDFDRELNSRGLKDGEFMAHELVKQFGKVHSIICSPAARTLATAHIFARESGIKENKILQEPGIYDSTPENLLHIIRSLPATTDHVLLVGHNPGFSMVASYLTGETIEMPTSSYVALDLDISLWSVTDPDCATLLAFNYPSKHLDS